MFKLLTPLALIFLFISVTATPQELTKVYGHELKHRLEPNGSKQYNAFFKAIKSYDIEFDLEVKPLSRSIRSFEKDKNSCLFPTSKMLVEKTIPKSVPIGTVESEPLDLISLHVFTNNQSKTIQKLDELNGKRIAVWGGLDVNTILKDTKPIIETTANEEIRLKMLKAKRIDAILGFKPDVQLASENLGFEQPKYNTELVLYKDEPASIVCHATPENKNFIEKINKIIIKMRKSGELKTILGGYAKVPD